MTNVDNDRRVRPVLSDLEFKLMLNWIDLNSLGFLKLRNLAILCILRITGKRREEIAGLENRDVWIEEPYLALNFRLLKKKRRKISENGTIIKTGIPPEKVRYILLKDPLAKHILDYMEYMESNYPDAQKFLPQARCIFGGPPIVFPNKGITGRQVYNIVRDSGDGAKVIVWPHLFRETAGAEEARQNPDLTGILKVMRRIDVTERTAWRYMERYVTSVIDRGESNNT